MGPDQVSNLIATDTQTRWYSLMTNIETNSETESYNQINVCEYIVLCCIVLLAACHTYVNIHLATVLETTG